ncbi:MAG: glycine betaine/proline transport system permease protein [Gammaproteobacteria bacterium]|jgi:glycine betaine/proline transport system permease protein
MQESGFSAEPAKLGSSIDDFVVENTEYYRREFEKIQSATKIPRSWNIWAAIGGPFWGAARGLWGGFWTFLVLEILALVQIGKGLWGELGADKLARIEKMEPKIQSFYEKYQVALEAAKPEDAANYLARSENLQKVVDRLMVEATAAAEGATTYLIVGLLFFVALRLFQGFSANIRYENQYLTWRAEHDKSIIGLSWMRVVIGAILWLAIVPLTLYRFTVGKIAPELEAYTLGFPVEKKAYFSPVANWMEDGFDQLSISGAGVFDGVVITIRTVLDGLETVFVGTPWPVVMTVIIVTAFRLAGPRVAIFTAASLAYLGFLGMWETSMITVALLGAAAFLCLLMGIPLGIWFGKSKRAYNSALPILDFMQTMPAFVYLIPIIAFFGTGKPPGVLATIIFGMPPVIRLTALGMRGVPETTKEAAIAFGATKWTLLKDVELPLAMPSIMTGINQTILMCLSMVVIASLIGAKGLGQDVLIALQYAAKGQGMLAGLAILFCAMVIDRIIQGHYKKKTARYTR